MAQGFVSPLQLTAASALLNNQGINTLPAALTSAVSSFDSTAVIADFLAALAAYQTKPYATAATLLSLQSIGNSTCPALGDSIPVAYTNLTPSLSGFAGLITQTGNTYLGNGDTKKFCQNFISAQGYQGTTNNFINSAVNAQTYLGPTFKGMDSLTTNGISNVNSNFVGFGTDLFKQGDLTNFSDINYYGTPAGLLRQLAVKANVSTGTILVVENPLVTAGLTKTNIKTLVQRPVTVTENEFNQLQKLAYQGMTNVTGADLQQVLSILEVTTPGIKTMADLLDQKKIFPLSWTTLKTPTPNGWVPVYQADGSVNLNIQRTVGIYLPTPTGCDDLGKIIPPDQAVANKATQVSLQQITGITGTTLPKLAQTVVGTSPNTWNINKPYLANSVVAAGAPVPTNYRAQQDVPAGTDINNTAYWLPTSLGGLSTMSGLPAIQSQTTAITSSVASQFSSLATGTGPNGTVTTCDIIGTAIDYNDFAADLTTATAAINTLDGLGALNALKATYVSMLSAANDPAWIALIATANTNITTIVSAQPTLVATLNTAFDSIASVLSQEKTYQTDGGMDFANTIGTTNSVYAFVQNLPNYGVQVDAGGPAYFLNQAADTSVAGGQAIVGSMREATNNQRLNTAGIGINITPPPNPAVTPSPVVTPVY